MAKRTHEKRLRKFDIIQGVTGKIELKPRTTYRPATARQKHTITCADGRKIDVMVAPGQIINTIKLCKKGKC